LVGLQLLHVELHAAEALLPEPPEPVQIRAASASGAASMAMYTTGAKTDTDSLTAVFGALANPTRRAILVAVTAASQGVRK
jgi:hypothetical protein